MAEPDLLRRLPSDGALLPPSVEPGGTAGKILTAGLRLFALHGYEGASVRDICAEAHVYATTIYSHYPSKEHVLAELIRLGHVEHLSRLRAALLEAGNDPHDQLAEFVRAHVLAHCDYPLLSVVTSAELHHLSAALAGPSLALRHEAETLFVDILARGVKLGAFNVIDPELALRAIASMGVRVPYWYEPGGPHDPGVIAETYARFALRLVKPS